MCLPPHWHVIGAPQVSPGTFFHVRSYQYHVRSYQSLRVIFILSNVDPGIPATCCAILLWRVSRQWASRSCEQQCNCNGNRKSISIRISENMSIAIVRKGLSKCPPAWIISIPWKFISITISIINLSIAIVRKGLSTSMGWDRARGQMRAKAKRRGRGDLGGNWYSWRKKINQPNHTFTDVQDCDDIFTIWVLTCLCRMEVRALLRGSTVLQRAYIEQQFRTRAHILYRTTVRNPVKGGKVRWGPDQICLEVWLSPNRILTTKHPGQAVEQFCMGCSWGGFVIHETFQGLQGAKIISTEGLSLALV